MSSESREPGNDERLKSGDSRPPHRRLVDYAQGAGLTQGQLAELLGVSRQWVNALATGKSSITLEVAQRLARISGHDVDYWLDFSDEDELSAVRRRSSAGPAAHVLVDFELEAVLPTGIVRPFDAMNIQPASYDLTLDPDARIVNGERVDLSSQPYALWPGYTALIKTREWIDLPKYYVGHIGPISDLAREGMFLSYGMQIDPGFSGPLMVSLHNHGEEVLLLKAGMPFLTMELVCLNAPPLRPYAGKNQNKAELSEPSSRAARSRIADGNFVLDHLGDPELTLIEHLDGIFISHENGWLAQATDVRQTGHGQTREDALTDLKHRISARFRFLRSEPRLQGRLAEELKTLTALIRRRAHLSFLELEALAKRLEAKIEDNGPHSRMAVIRNDDISVGAFAIPEAGRPVPLEVVAAELSLEKEQLFSLLNGQSGREQYLAWIGAV